MSNKLKENWNAIDEIHLIKREQMLHLIVSLIGRVGVVLALCVLFINVFTLEMVKQNPGNIWLNRFIGFSILTWVFFPAITISFKFIDFIKKKYGK